MQILLIKTSSLGDVFHTLPALTDAHRAIPGLRVDWVVEEAFAQIPSWHPAVAEVIPLAWRRWRQQLTKARTWGEMRGFYRALTANRYDLVLDAQGLLKSALVTRLAQGPRCGLSRRSAREPLASLAYDRPMDIAKGQHAIHRLRQLFARCLGYDTPQHELDYGIDKRRWPAPHSDRPYVVFLHGSTWDTKLWPEDYWRQLRDLAIADGYGVVLPWGNAEERERAVRLAAATPQARVFDKAPLEEVARLLAHASAVVGVDTGLSHVAAALDVPTVAIYGATDASLTGVLGPRVRLLSADYRCAPCLSKQCAIAPQGQAVYPPCYASLDPQTVWAAAVQQLGTNVR
jgi:heptosyltransferase-1